MFENIEDTREQYLILMVHGIGTIEEYQVKNLLYFKTSVHKVQAEMFRESPYECVIRMVDWNTLLKSD